MAEDTARDALIKRLRDAAMIVDEVMEALDVSEQACDNCGGRHFLNRKQAKAFENIESIPTKLRRTATSLEGNNR